MRNNVNDSDTMISLNHWLQGTDVSWILKHTSLSV